MEGHQPEQRGSGGRLLRGEREWRTAGRRKWPEVVELVQDREIGTEASGVDGRDQLAVLEAVAAVHGRLGGARVQREGVTWG
jgi:hypothetical protein